VRFDVDCRTCTAASTLTTQAPPVYQQTATAKLWKTNYNKWK